MQPSMICKDNQGIFQKSTTWG